MCSINSFIPKIEHRDGFTITTDSFNVSVEGKTIGGKSEIKNQDDYCIYCINNILFSAVFDGHGRNEGKFISYWSRKIFLEFIKSEMFMVSYTQNPESTIQIIFEDVNEKIKEKVFNKYIELGYAISKDENGHYIITKGLNTFIVNGGTMATVLIFDFNSNKQYTAYVGDSEATFLDYHHGDKEESIFKKVPELSTLTEYCHDAFNLEEYIRIQEYKSYPDFPEKPLLQFNYDLRGSVAPIWNFDEGEYKKSEPQAGYYYKNTSKEIATYLQSVNQKNNLTTTRSIGDFTLKYYGVTYEPTIFVNKIKKGIYTIASDGVWDNFEKTFFSETVTRIISESDDLKITQLVNNFMDYNLHEALSNFGESKDDATCIFLKIE